MVRFRSAPRRAAQVAALGGAVVLAVLGLSLSASAAPPARQDCAGLSALRIPHTTVTRAVADTSGSFTVTDGAAGPGGTPPGTVLTGLPSFCEITLVTTHPPAHDAVTIEVWLPIGAWNGRFQGVGGGGYVIGVSWSALGDALQQGYAVASTDTGHPAQQWLGQFALNADGTPNTASITDFAYRAIHEMTVDGKAAVQRFYGTAPSYSYFDGCSQGGRQGLAEAQRYPSDYNGIVSGSPAVDFPRLSIAQTWPYFVMQRADDFLPACKFAAFQAAAVTACDRLDGVADGQIANVAACRYDPRRLVGTATPCGVITATDAAVMAQIWPGPRTVSGRFLWYGLEPGSDPTILGRTVTDDNGVTTGSPLYIGDSWLRYWVTRDPSFDWSTVSTASFTRLFAQGVTMYPDLASDDPDLTAFRAHGGKLLLWAGLGDPLIPPQSAVHYYDDVARHMGRGTDSFARLFLAPAVGHCGVTGNTGPVPTGQLDAVRAWVEQGTAPAQLPATTVVGGRVTAARPVCSYPRVARFLGGDPADAASYRCARSF